MRSLSAFGAQAVDLDLTCCPPTPSETHVAGESAEAVARRMREKAARLQRSAELWQRGADGERATGEALDALPQQYWTVLHDVAWPGRPRANIDHVAVGPPGVFVIDAKNWSGVVTLRDGHLRQAGRSRLSAVSGVDAAASAVAGVLLPTGAAVTRGILCLAGESRVSGVAGSIVVRSVSDLRDYLLSLPPVVHERSLTELADQVRTRLASAAVSAPTGAGQRESAKLPRPQAAARPARSAERATRPGISADLLKLLCVVALLVALATQPQIFAKAATGMAELFTSSLQPDASTDPVSGSTDAPSGGTEKTKQARERKRSRSAQP